jgi:hypothetical protein
MMSVCSNTRLNNTMSLLVIVFGYVLEYKRCSVSRILNFFSSTSLLRRSRYIHPNTYNAYIPPLSL